MNNQKLLEEFENINKIIDSYIEKGEELPQALCAMFSIYKDKIEKRFGGYMPKRKFVKKEAAIPPNKK